jgi:methylated-DNA-[protein]-cysteine S-methyltransferase
MKTETYYTYHDSPVGCLLLTSDGTNLTRLHMIGQLYQAVPDSNWKKSDELPIFQTTRQQLDSYFRGELQAFELPLKPEGTEFQKRVWSELERIPYGITISYGELASRVGNVNASRAVGLANGKNPIGIIVPCHRVIGASGKLTGYSAGIDRKAKLLNLEAGFGVGSAG